MNPIWFQPFSLEELNQRSQNTLAECLGISFIDITANTLTATMPVVSQTKQPIGILHGGANVVLAETLASTAANAAVDLARYYCVGLEINANHLRSVSSGFVTGVTRPIHLGQSTQIWQIDIFDETGRQSCVSRMTAAVLSRK